MPATQPAYEWLTVPEAADRLKVGKDKIYEACKRGLKSSKLGHSTLRIRSDWLEAWAVELAEGRTE